jgi:hypothetical protein
MASWARPWGFLSAALLAACSSGTSPAVGSSGNSGGSGASSATGAGASGPSGAAGSTSGAAAATGTVSSTSGATSSGVGGAGSGAGGAGTSGTGTGSGASGGALADGGAPGDGGADSQATEAGATSCAGGAISLSANGTGTMSDAARARVVIDMMSDLPIGNSDRTIEFWAYIKPTDWVGERNEIFVYGVGGTLQQLGLDFGTYTVTGMPDNHATLNPYTDGIFDSDDGTYLGITSAMTQWVHIAMTWDGTALRTYVNGVLRITTMAAGKMLETTTSPLTMGCNPPYFGCFNGLFDELRVWNVARSADDIMASYDKALVGNETGLVGYWKFNDAPGSTTAADSVTTAGHTAHTGQLTSATDAGMPTFVTPDPPAPVGCP